jgi:NAD(P)-dependent dehydrogenase (short-subunit alcohol dehydrogenase family)
MLDLGQEGSVDKFCTSVNLKFIFIPGVAWAGAYSTSKFAVRGLTQSAGEYYAIKQIIVPLLT